MIASISGAGKRARSRTMRSFLIFLAIVACALSCSFPILAAEKEIIKDKAPNGKFALRIGAPDDSGYAKIQVIELSTHQPVADLGTLGHPYEEDAKLRWAGDSQRVAFFEPTKRGGLTRVYFRNGTLFEEVQLPILPEPSPAKKVAPDASDKTITALQEPMRWLKSGALVIYSEAEGDYSGRSALEITVGFDQNHKPSVVKSKKVNPRSVGATMNKKKEQQ
jgi:hypothetical protein